jgi:hypothetical protein
MPTNVADCPSGEEEIPTVRPKALHADTLLRRVAVAAELTAAGFPVSPTTLATQASRGGGPPYELWGRIPLYRWGKSLDWAKARLSPPRRSTSESDAV